MIRRILACAVLSVMLVGFIIIMGLKSDDYMHRIVERDKCIKETGDVERCR